MKKLLSLMLAALLLCGALTMTACEKQKPADESGETADTGEVQEMPADTEGPGTITVGEGENCAATLDEALAAAKELRANGYTDRITIRLKAGEYFCEETVEIDETMSDLTIEAFGDGDVAIYGGYEVTGFEPDTFNGAACLSAPVRDGEFTDFYVNGLRANMTRYPAEGYLFPTGFENEDTGLFSGSRWFIAPDDAMAGFSNIENIYLTGFHYWVDEHSPVESYDPETRKVTLCYPTRVTIADTKPSAVSLAYYLENMPETFGEHTNEWFAADGKVYYIPRDESITPETIRAFVPVVTKLMYIHGTAETPVTGIEFRNLTLGVTKGDYVTDYFGEFFGSDNQACSWMDGYIMVDHAADCVFEDDLFTEYGQHGLVLERGCQNIRISRCTFFDGGGGGIKIVGDNDGTPGATGHNTVEDCTITECGKRHFASTGILIQDSGYNTIQHNEVSYMSYSGISCGWKWGYDENPCHDNLITKNHVHHIGNEGPLSDMAAIYTLGIQTNTVISYNLVHDVSYWEHGYGARGFGMDQGSSNLTFENNISYNTQTTALGCGIGENNVIRNNIFFSGNAAVVDDGTQEKHVTLNFENNIFVTDGVPVHDINRDALSKKCVKSSNNLIFNLSGDETVAISIGEDKQWNLADSLRFFGLEEGSIEADPGFADLENHDFTLAEDSPALAVGFVPFDMSDVGPRT